MDELLFEFPYAAFRSTAGAIHVLGSKLELTFAMFRAL